MKEKKPHITIWIVIAALWLTQLMNVYQFHQANRSQKEQMYQFRNWTQEQIHDLTEMDTEILQIQEYFLEILQGMVNCQNTDNPSKNSL